MYKCNIERLGQGGFNSYRIPGIVTTPNATIIIYYEIRDSEHNDWSTVNIGMKRSTDNGKTWSERILLYRGEPVPLNNPIMIATKERLIYMWQTNYRRTYIQYSYDDGLTFTEPKEITYVFDEYKDEYDWSVYAVGPGHGIVLSDNSLLIPIWICKGEGNSHQPSVVSTIRSFDNGDTFIRGNIIYDTDKMVSPNETTAAQLSNGKAMLNIRHYGDNSSRFVTTGDISTERIAFEPIYMDKGLPDPRCCGSLLFVPNYGLYFSNCNSMRIGNWGHRINLTLRHSDDCGLTWDDGQIISEYAGYSDISYGVYDRKTYIYCLYEAKVPGISGDPEELNFAAIELV